VLAVAAACAFVAPSLQPARVDAQGGTEAALAAFERTVDAFSRVRGTVPSGAHDLDALGLDLAFEEPEAIAAAVHEAVAYEPYAGVLRGPASTWSGRAGNALDQALLLARLLIDAGYDAEVAMAEVDDAAARDVLAMTRAAAAPPAPDWAAAGVAPEDLVTDASELDRAAEEATAVLDELRADVDAASAWLAERGVLDDAAGLGGEAVLDDARSYAWVRYRLGSADPWSALHPVFDAAPTWTEALEPERTLAGVVPEELTHRLRIEAFVERRVGDDVEVKPLFAAWERPVANLVGVPVTLGFAPDGIDGDDAIALDLDAVSEATVFFAPTLGTALAPGALLLDRLGNTVDQLAGASPAAGLFGALGNLANEATQELGGEGLQMTSVWYTFTFVRPDGSEVAHRRALFDRVEPSDRAAGVLDGELAEMDDRALFDALAVTHTLQVAPTRVHAAQAERVRLDAELAILDYHRALWLAGVEGDGVPPTPSSDLADAVVLERMTSTFAAFDAHPVPEGSVAIRHEPTLVVVRTPLDRSTALVDVVQNPRRVLRVGEADGELDRAAALRAGVWETATERVAAPAGSVAVQDTLAFVASATDADVAWRTLRAGDAAPAALPSATRAAIADDLAAGYVVVAPEGLPPGVVEASWWRVDPVTGTALGRMADGRGGATTEYSTLQYTVSGQLIGQALNVGSYGACRAAGNGNACCLGDAAAGTVVGLGLGAIIGAKVAADAAFAIGVGLDFANFGVGMTGVLPSFC
jgi:hypothetical protein